MLGTLVYADKNSSIEGVDRWIRRHLRPPLRLHSDLEDEVRLQQNLQSNVYGILLRWSRKSRHSGSLFSPVDPMTPLRLTCGLQKGKTIYVLNYSSLGYDMTATLGIYNNYRHSVFQGHSHSEYAGRKQSFWWA